MVRWAPFNTVDGTRMARQNIKQRPRVPMPHVHVSVLAPTYDDATARPPERRPKHKPPLPEPRSMIPLDKCACRQVPTVDLLRGVASPTASTVNTVSVPAVHIILSLSPPKGLAFFTLPLYVTNSGLVPSLCTMPLSLSTLLK